MGVGAGVNTTFWSVTGPGPAKPPGQGAYVLEWALQISDTQFRKFYIFQKKKNKTPNFFQAQL